MIELKAAHPLWLMSSACDFIDLQPQTIRVRHIQFNCTGYKALAMESGAITASITGSLVERQRLIKEGLYWF